MILSINYSNYDAFDSNSNVAKFQNIESANNFVEMLDKNGYQIDSILVENEKLVFDNKSEYCTEFAMVYYIEAEDEYISVQKNEDGRFSIGEGENIPDSLGFSSMDAILGEEILNDYREFLSNYLHSDLNAENFVDSLQSDYENACCCQSGPVYHIELSSAHSNDKCPHVFDVNSENVTWEFN